MRDKLREASTSLVFLNNAAPTRAALRYLADWLMHDTTIDSLTFEGPHFKAKGLEILLPALKLGNIKVLKLRGTNIGDTGAIYLGELLALNLGLEHLDLTQNQITTHGAQHLALGLRTNNTLRELNLQGNCLQSTGIKYLMDQIGNNIELLDVGHCNIGDLGLKYIADRLNMNLMNDTTHGDTHIMDIDTEHDASVDDIDVVPLLHDYNIQTSNEKILGMWKLKFLRLTCNGITSTGMWDLVGALNVNPGIRGLDLESNNLYDIGLRSLMDMMIEGRQFDYLNLCLTHPGDEALSKLTQILRGKCRIVDLNLNQTMLGGHMVNGELTERQLGSFVPCFATNSSLKRCSLRCTRLRPADLTELITNMQLNVNLNLNTLDLSQNYFTGAVSLRDLAQIRGLEHLILESSGIDNIGMMYLCQGLADGNVQSIDVGGDDECFDVIGMQHLVRAVRSNAGITEVKVDWLAGVLSPIRTMIARREINQQLDFNRGTCVF
jgi:Ran GTPase-activating protein (RanGAP) involved in mRNA processing and transport